MIAGCEPFRVWSRLEPRPRQAELGNVLQARIQDALWMLARQWQFGEFHGEDSGSPVVATLARTLSPVVAVGVGGGTAVAYDASVPLEATVEQLPVTFPAALRAHLGSHAAGLVAARTGVTAAAVQAALATAYPLSGPAAPPAGDLVAAARASLTGLADRVQQALAGRAVDGVALATAQQAGQALADLPGPVAALAPGGDGTALLAALEEIRAWFSRLYPQPDAAGGGWDGTRLEYAYDVVVARDGGTGLGLRGGPTPDGRVDWYSFDVTGPAAVPAAAPPPSVEVSSALPGAVSYSGMPSARWWQMEDAAVSLGSMRADSTDLAKIIVTDFALVYGNDWFAIPYQQTIGTLAEISGLVVTDVFGYRTLIKAATGAAGPDWSAWDLFSLSAGAQGADPLGQHLFLPPALPLVRPGPVFEEVSFVRDDAATMAWAIETTVPDGLGGGRDGAAAARRMTAALAPPAGQPASGPAVSGAAQPGLRYLLGATVPENWIPFVPVHTGDDTHSIRLQRAWMPREAPAGSRVRPVTTILRYGIGADDTQSRAYFVNEEEIPRSGIRVSASMHRARWTDGSTVVWHARRTTAGRGEGSSGLRFDVLEQ